MVLASIAYRSKTLKRGMSADKIKTTLESIDPGNITIPTDPALAYSSKSISDDFSVVLSTEDSEVSGVLGNDGVGGTKSGFQAGPRDCDNRRVPLPHASHGPPPRAGEELFRLQFR
jgi:hypothetical protein